MLVGGQRTPTTYLIPLHNGTMHVHDTRARRGMGLTGGLERLAQAVRRPERGLIRAINGVECGGAAETDDAVLLGPCAVRRLVDSLR